jgi:epsilon-lactone hydrolase
VQQAADEALPRLAKARAALGVSIEPTTVGGVKAFLLTPKEIPEADKNQLVFNIHGGGYIFGPGESGTEEAMLMAVYGGYKVLAIDYRMPPDGPYPAGMDDLTAAWRAVIATTDPRRVAVEGTSAGGGMALALMLRAKAEGMPLPAAIAPGTPSSDLTNTGDSYKTNEWIDNVLVSVDGYPSRGTRLYAHGHDLKDPQLSPIYGDFHGLPPAILTTGTRDLFLSNTVRVHRKFREAGVDADLQVYEGLSHAQYLFDPCGTVPKEVFGEITRFFDAHLAK